MRATTRARPRRAPKASKPVFGGTTIGATPPDWIKKLDAFLTFNERNILTNAGKVSAAMAEEHAAGEFGKFERGKREREASGVVSDFDRVVERAKGLEAGEAVKAANKGKHNGD